MAMAPDQRTERSPRGERSPTSPKRAGLWFLRWSSRMNRLVVLLFALGIVVIAINAKFFLDVSREIGSLATVRPGGNSALTGAVAPEHNTGVWGTSAFRLSTAFAVTVIWFVAVMYLLVKKIVVPVNKVAVAAKAILEGNLSATVPANPHSELGDVSRLLNELSTDFQEILLLTGTAVGDSLSALEKMQQTQDEAPQVSVTDLRHQIHGVRQHLEMLRATVEDFQYYQAKFNGRAAFGDSSDAEEADSVRRHDLHPAVDCGSELDQPHTNRAKGKRDD